MPTETVYLSSNLLHITVDIDGCETRALVDSGASVSIINKDKAKVSNTYIGKRVQVQSYDGKKKFYEEWTNVVVGFEGQSVDIEALVMDGVDYEFLLSRPDMKRLRINIYWNDEVRVDKTSDRRFLANGKLDTTPKLVTTTEEIPKLYPELSCVGSYPRATTQFTVPFVISNKTVVRKKPYNMTREKKVWLKHELQNMLEANIIRPSVSAFASPITIAPKEDGTFRLCTDYRALNKQTELIPFPMPRIDAIIDETGGCRHFSRIDLCKGFWQVPLQEETKKYTAFITPFDLYEYNCLPFGWKNSPAWFQKMMNQVLHPYLGRFCNVYVDDIIVYSQTEMEHRQHLSQVLSALSSAELKVNFKKSVFFQTKVVFLGRVFDGSTKSTKDESVARISQLVKPYDVHSLRVFLGLSGHFRAFIQDYALKTKCLTRLMQKDVSFDWTEECENAYRDMVHEISSDPILSLPDFSLPFELNTDASHYGTGAVLYQRDAEQPTHRQLRVVGYHSYTFSKPELNYTTTEKEALAVLKAIRYFRSHLEGTTFKLFTDHQALTHILHLTQAKGRLARWVNELQQFQFDIIHRSGSSLTDADALSRLLVNGDNPEAVNHAKLWEGTECLLFKNGKFQVPPSLVLAILHEYHDSPDSGGHDGFWRTYKKLTKRFTWPNMKQDTSRYIRSCHECQVHKAKFKRSTDVMTTPEYSKKPFEVVHLDFAELKKKSEGVKRTQAFLLCIDECTRTVAARAGREDANSVITLLNRETFKNVKVIKSDNGPAFRSKQLEEWARERGISLKFSAPYHPAANGLAERSIRDIKQYITMYPSFPGGWKCCLEAAVSHHNRSFTKGLGCSPVFAVTGKLPFLPADYKLSLTEQLRLTETPKTDTEKQMYRSNMKRNFDRRHNAAIPNLKVDDLVLVRKGISGSSANFCGPYRVLKTATQQGVLKTIWYMGPNERMETASIGNVFQYYPRRDNF